MQSLCAIREESGLGIICARAASSGICGTDIQLRKGPGRTNPTTGKPPDARGASVHAAQYSIGHTSGTRKLIIIGGGLSPMFSSPTSGIACRPGLTISFTK